MKCTICGHKTMPGAMLCGPCRAALKRARYMSVQVAPPSSMMPRRARAGAAHAAGSPRATTPPSRMTAVPGTIAEARATARPMRGPLLQSLAIAVAAFAALGVAAYLGQPPVREIRSTADTIVAAPSAVAGPGSTLADEKMRGSKGADMDAPVSSVAEVPVEPAPPPAAGRILRSPLPSARPAGTPMLVAGQGADVQEAVQEAPLPVPTLPAPVFVPPPPPDRWQAMRDDLSRCDREGGFSGFICDQRVRLASCDGHWGRVPQCPLPTENPGGQ